MCNPRGWRADDERPVRRRWATAAVDCFQLGLWIPTPLSSFLGVNGSREGLQAKSVCGSQTASASISSLAAAGARIRGPHQPPFSGLKFQNACILKQILHNEACTSPLKQQATANGSPDKGSGTHTGRLGLARCRSKAVSIKQATVHAWRHRRRISQPQACQRRSCAPLPTRAPELCKARLCSQGRAGLARLRLSQLTQQRAGLPVARLPGPPLAVAAAERQLAAGATPAGRGGRE